MVGGDSCDLALAKKWAEKCQFFNLYGPTEATIYATSCQIHLQQTRMSIGKPISNTACYIVNADMQLQPIGVAGELCIGGARLARGYHNRQQLTANQFIDNPFDKGKFYRTGDLARWLSDGTIELLGRIDNQVKIRGFRIELGEIESVLQNHPLVTDAVTITRGSGVAKQLQGFVVPRHKKILDDREALQTLVDELAQSTRNSLPEYMISANNEIIPSIPLTSNGKIDCAGLLTMAENLTTQTELELPGSELGLQLASI